MRIPTSLNLVWDHRTHKHWTFNGSLVSLVTRTTHATLCPLTHRMTRWCSSGPPSKHYLERLERTEASYSLQIGTLQDVISNNHVWWSNISFTVFFLVFILKTALSATFTKCLFHITQWSPRQKISWQVPSQQIAIESQQNNIRAMSWDVALMLFCWLSNCFFCWNTIASPMIIFSQLQIF